ncbi:MAG TPA: DUF5719 family protein [Actinomycetes bacterium]
MSDRHPEWREQPDYRDWPDYQGEADADQEGNGRHGKHGRGQPPPPTAPDWPYGTRPAGQPLDEDRPEQGGRRWAGPAAPGWRGAPASPPQPGGERQGQDRPDQPGRRWADQGTPPATGEVWGGPAVPEQRGGWPTGEPAAAQGWPDPAQSQRRGDWQDAAERPAHGDQPPPQGRRDAAQRRGGRHDSGQWSTPGWHDPAEAQRRGRHDSGEWQAPAGRDAGERSWADQGPPGEEGAGGPSGQGRRGAPAAPAGDWGEPAAERPGDPGWRGPEGQGPTSGEWPDPRGGFARPEPGGQDAPGGWPPQDQPGGTPPGRSDSGRVVADRAQRNSGRITGRLTRRTDRGSLFRGRRGAAGGDTPAPPEAREAAPEPASPPAWAGEQPGGEQAWSPPAPQAPPEPGSTTAWSGGQAWTPPAPEAPPDTGSQAAPWTTGPPSVGQPWSQETPTVERGGEPPRPTPPHAWARGAEAAPPRFAEPARFVAPAPEQRPGYVDGQDRGHAPYREAPAGGGEHALGAFGYRGLPPQEQEAWDDEPADPDEDGAAPAGDGAGRWGGAQAPAARGRQGRGAHGRTRSRTRPRLPKVGRARIPQASLALAGIAIVVAGGLVSLMNVVPKAAPPKPVDAGAPYSARWVCPLLPNSVGTVTANNVGRTAASIEAGSAGQQAGGQPAQQLAARATHTFHAPSGPAGGFVQVEAFGAPVAATAANQPPCVAGPGTRWWLPGLTSSAQSKVTLVIANPESADASVNIIPHLTEGSVHPEPLQNVFVRAGATVSKVINVAEVQNLSYTAEVVASQGRVVVGASLDSSIGNRREHLIVPAQPAMRSSWSFSGGLRGEARQVWLLVTNPNPEPLSLVVDGVNDQGPFKVDGFDLPIADGAINEALVPVNVGKSAVFGLRVRSQDGSKFVAALRYGAGGGPIDTTHLDLGGSGLDARWMAPVVPDSRRLVLSNTAEQPVTATLSALGGAAGGAAVTEAGKDGSVTVGPGQVRYTDVPKGVQSLLLVADAPGLVAAPVGPGQLVPGSEVGGVPLEGAVTAGPAAAP